MADHLSMQIRAALKARIGSIAGLSVHGRAVSLAESDLPAAKLWFDEGRDERQPTGSMNAADTLSFMTDVFSLEISVKTSGDVDDALDALRKSVRIVLSADRRLAGLCRDIRIAAVARTSNLDGDRKVASDSYSIEVDYLIRDSAPDVPVQAV